MEPATAREQLTTVMAYLKSISGNGPEHIRRLCADASIRGVPTDSCACPIAQLVWGATSVQVSICGLSVSIVGSDFPGLRSYAVPHGVASFIRRFDNGEYPELVRPAPVPA